MGSWPLIKAFGAAQVTPYGPRRLSGTVREALHAIEEARACGVSWAAIASDLSEARRGVGKSAVDENTLRGVAGRALRARPVAPPSVSMMAANHLPLPPIREAPSKHSFRPSDLNATPLAPAPGTKSSPADIAARLARLKELNDDEDR